MKMRPLWHTLMTLEGFPALWLWWLSCRQSLHSLLLLLLLGCCCCCASGDVSSRTSLPPLPPTSAMDSFDPVAYEGRWFVDLYTGESITDLAGCLTYEIRGGHNPKMLKVLVSYATISNSTKSTRITIKRVPEKVGHYAVDVGADRLFESVIVHTDYASYSVLWVRVATHNIKMENVFVSTRTPGAWRAQQNLVDQNLIKAGVDVTTAQLGTIDNVAFCAPPQDT